MSFLRLNLTNHMLASVGVVHASLKAFGNTLLRHLQLSFSELSYHHNFKRSSKGQPDSKLIKQICLAHLGDQLVRHRGQQHHRPNLRHHNRLGPHLRLLTQDRPSNAPIRRNKAKVLVSSGRWPAPLRKLRPYSLHLTPLKLTYS